jgi:hypothetical protein
MEQSSRLSFAQRQVCQLVFMYSPWMWSFHLNDWIISFVYISDQFQVFIQYADHVPANAARMVSLNLQEYLSFSWLIFAELLHKCLYMLSNMFLDYITLRIVILGESKCRLNICCSLERFKFLFFLCNLYASKISSRPFQHNSFWL